MDPIPVAEGESLDTIAQSIAAWQPFFNALAEICATLAGLLFVAISLHPANKDAGAKTNLRRLAEHTFSDLLQVLFIGIFFSVPAQPPAFYAACAVAIAVSGLREPLRRLWEVWRDRANARHRNHFIRRVGFSLAGRGMLCLGGVTLLLHRLTTPDVGEGLLFVFGGSLILMISAMRNAWFLMLQEMEAA